MIDCSKLKVLTIILIVLLLNSCKKQEPISVLKWKTHDLDVFTLKIPEDWKYEKKRGFDSFIGRFRKDSLTLNFDYSRIGASGKFYNEEYFLSFNAWDMSECFSCEDSVMYTYNPEDYNLEELHKKGEYLSIKRVELIDPPQLDWIMKVEGSLKKDYPNADYIAKYTVDNKSKVIKIKLPNYIKEHKIQAFKKGNSLLQIATPSKLDSLNTIKASLEDLSSRKIVMMKIENVPLNQIELIKKIFHTVVFKDEA